MTAQRELGPNIVDLVEVDALREEVRKKYREVADSPTAKFHFHTGRAHALRMGYPASPLGQLPEEATEAFAGVANPFYWDLPREGESFGAPPARTQPDPQALVTVAGYRTIGACG